MWASCGELLATPPRRQLCLDRWQSPQQPRTEQCRTHATSSSIRQFLKLDSKSLASRERITPHDVSPRLPVPDSIPRPHYVADKSTSPENAGVQIHTKKGIKKMKAACQLAARVLQHAGTLVKAGITTDEIDRVVHKMIIDHGAYPSPLMYGSFPKSVCTSVNEVLCHGIPDSRALKDGDIINIDVTAFLEGYHGDCSAMFHVGAVSPEAKRLCEVTKQCMDVGIAQCRPGVPIRNIGKAMEDLAHANKYRICPEFVGHGVGRWFHSAPMVLPVASKMPDTMQVGQTFTIEPILVEQSAAYNMWKDNWTVVAKDGGLSAQWEHTVLITPTGHEVLTIA